MREVREVPAPTPVGGVESVPSAGSRRVRIVSPWASVDVTVMAEATVCESLPALIRLTRSAAGRRETPAVDPLALARADGTWLEPEVAVGRQVAHGDSLFLVPVRQHFEPPSLAYPEGLWAMPSDRPPWAGRHTRRLVLVLGAAAAVPVWFLAPFAPMPITAACALAFAVLAFLLTYRWSAHGPATVAALSSLPLWVVSAWQVVATWVPAALADEVGVAFVGSAALGLAAAVLRVVARTSIERAAFAGVLAAAVPICLTTVTSSTLRALGADPGGDDAVTAALLLALGTVIVLLRAPNVALLFAGGRRPVDRDSGGDAPTQELPVVPRRSDGPVRSDPAAVKRDCLTGVLAGASLALAGAWIVLLLHPEPRGVIVLAVTIVQVWLMVSGYREVPHRLVLVALAAAGAACAAAAALAALPPGARPWVLTTGAVCVILLAARTGLLARLPQPRLVRLAELAERALVVTTVPLVLLGVGAFSAVLDFGAWWAS